MYISVSDEHNHVCGNILKRDYGVDVWMDVQLVGWEDCFDPFIGGGDLIITGTREIKVWVGVTNNMVTGYKVFNMGDNFL